MMNLGSSKGKRGSNPILESVPNKVCVCVCVRLFIMPP